MCAIGKLKISKLRDGDDDYTKVTFCPDLSKFEMEKLDNEIVALMSRRAYDVSRFVFFLNYMD